MTGTLIHHVPVLTSPLLRWKLVIYICLLVVFMNLNWIMHIAVVTRLC